MNLISQQTQSKGTLQLTYHIPKTHDVPLPPRPGEKIMGLQAGFQK